MSELKMDDLKAALPANISRSLSQETLDNLNTLVTDPEMREVYRENLIGYAHVMQQGKFKVSQYLDAVRYVSYKLMGDTNIAAYTKTFPDKIARFDKQGVSSKDVASYVTAYNKSKLVNLIYEQTLVPSWVLNQDLYQRALNVQAELMLGASSEKVRSDAANSILTHLKPPEVQKIELDVGVKEDSTIAALRQSTMELVAQQKKMMESGAMGAQEVAHSKLVVDGEYEDVSPE